LKPLTQQRQCDGQLRMSGWDMCLCSSGEST
jgi:hypothetical protein